MANTQRTWTDISNYVEDIMAKEGAKPQKRIIRALANEALGIISEQSRIYKNSWSNASGGALTLSANSATLPNDLILFESLEWDGDDNTLDKTSESWLDNNQQGWRSDTGEPNKYALTGTQVILNTAPTGTTTGKLVIRGIGQLPEFPDPPEKSGATNPLTNLPWQHQLLPAFYVIANLPVVPFTPMNASQEAVIFASQETKRRYETREIYGKKFQDGLDALIGTTRRRKFSEFKY